MSTDCPHYALYPETGGSWVGTLTEVQRAVWDKFASSATIDWPGNSFAGIRQVTVCWDLGICGELLYEAIACWVHYNVRGRQVPAYLKAWMEGREELAG